MKRLVLLGLVALGLAGAVYKVVAPKRVEVVTVSRGPALEAVYATGTIEADPRVVVKAKTPGTVVELLVKEGDAVKAGQLLARLDNKSLRYDLQRVRADVRASSARSRASSPQIEALKAARDSIAADLRLAESDVKRAETLTAKGALSQAESDAKHDRRDKLRAELAAAEARLSSLQIDLRADWERVSAQAGSMRAQNEDTELRAPIDGVVIDKRVELGEAVWANQPLFTVGRTAHLVLEVKIDEADVGRVRLGQEALIDLYAFASQVVTGRVSELFPDAERDTKTFRGKVELDTPPMGLRSGMSAEVNIITARHADAVLVPAAAVHKGALLVVKDGRLRRRPVRLGLRDPQRVEVLAGVQPGESVVLLGGGELEDGQRVRPVAIELPEQTRKSSSTISER